MKITPAKDYKKPLYAVGLAATVMTMAVTGCTAPATKSKDRSKNSTDYFYMQMLGGTTLVGEEPDDVGLAGDVQVVDPDVDYAGETTVSEPAETDVKLEGGAPVDE